MKRFISFGIGLIPGISAFAQSKNNELLDCLNNVSHERASIILMIIIYILVFIILANAFVCMELSISQRRKGEAFKSWKHQVMLFVSGLFIGMSIICLLMLHILL